MPVLDKMATQRLEKSGGAVEPARRQVLAVRLGHALLLVTALMIFVTAALAIRNELPSSSVFFLVGVLMAVPTAWLIIARQPRNPVGWFVAAFAFCFALGEFSHQYTVYGLFRNPGVLPAIRLISIPVHFIWFPGLICVLVLLPLYFPTGQLPSPRWRPVVWVAWTALVFVTCLAALRPGAFEIPGYPNPLGLPALIAPPALVNLIFDFLQVSWILLGIVAASSLVIRYRRAPVIERQQLKWFSLAISGMVVYGVIGRFLPPDFPSIIGDIVLAILLSAIWAAIGIAILRYRLFDIDLLIRRTVTYSIVTAALVAVYFVSVVILQQLFVTLTGTGQNELVTVLSTLAIAALFVPARNRIQNVIDRRFYRKKYDAQQVLNDFAKTVRDETDIDRLTGRLMQVVDETMQPRSVSVWLKQEEKIARGK